MKKKGGNERGGKGTKGGKGGKGGNSRIIEFKRFLFSIEI